MSDDNHDRPEVFSRKGVRLSADDECAVVEWDPEVVVADLGYDSANIEFGIKGDSGDIRFSYSTDAGPVQMIARFPGRGDSRPDDDAMIM